MRSFCRTRGHSMLTRSLLSVCAVLAVCGWVAQAQSKSEPAKASLTGHYDGTATNAGENIAVTLELTEKEGTISGMIRSSHGDFSITKGSHDGEKVMLEFDADGEPGTLTLKAVEDKLTGDWSAGGEGGSVEVKKVAAPQPDAKGKS